MHTDTRALRVLCVLGSHRISAAVPAGAVTRRSDIVPIISAAQHVERSRHATTATVEAPARPGRFRSAQPPEPAAVSSAFDRPDGRLQTIAWRRQRSLQFPVLPESGTLLESAATATLQLAVRHRRPRSEIPRRRACAYATQSPALRARGGRRSVKHLNNDEDPPERASVMRGCELALRHERVVRWLGVRQILEYGQPDPEMPQLGQLDLIERKQGSPMAAGAALVA